MRFVNPGGALRLLEARNIAEGTVEYLRGVLGLKQAGYRDKLIVRTPDQNETAFFKLPDDGRVSVIEIRRIAFDDNGGHRCDWTVYPADRNQFRSTSAKFQNKSWTLSSPGEQKQPGAQTCPATTKRMGSG